MYQPDLSKPRASDRRPNTESLSFKDKVAENVPLLRTQIGGEKIKVIEEADADDRRGEWFLRALRRYSCNSLSRKRLATTLWWWKVSAGRSVRYHWRMGNPRKNGIHACFFFWFPVICVAIVKIYNLRPLPCFRPEEFQLGKPSKIESYWSYLTCLIVEHYDGHILEATCDDPILFCLGCAFPSCFACYQVRIQSEMQCVFLTSY